MAGLPDNKSLFPIEGLLGFKRDTYENTLSNQVPLVGLITDMWEEGKLPFIPSPRGLPSTGLLYMMTQDSDFPPSDKPLYHVTRTSSIPSIEKEGIGMFRPTNWVKGEEGGDRYGEGEIYSFEDRQDALNWATKWDWELNNAFGTGDVSIIKHKTGEIPWEVDDADPLSQLGKKGGWLKRKHSVPVEDLLDIESYGKELFEEFKRNK
jgi:hypothetical protein